MGAIQIRTGVVCAALGSIATFAADRVLLNAPAAAARGIGLVGLGTPPPCPGDNNNDSVVNAADLSVLLANFGNVCSGDIDADGVPDAIDNCATAPNPDQADANANGIGDACDCSQGPCPPGPPHTTSACIENQCVPVCESGFAECNASLADGCEIDVRTSADLCSLPVVDLGAACADPSCDPDCTPSPLFTLANTSGSGNAMFRVRAVECSFGCQGSLTHTISLSVPPGANYDLFALRTACNGALIGLSTNPGSAAEGFDLDQPDTPVNNTFDYLIFVRYQSGPPCDQWNLTVQGRLCQ